MSARTTPSALYSGPFRPHALDVESLTLTTSATRVVAAFFQRIVNDPAARSTAVNVPVLAPPTIEQRSSFDVPPTFVTNFLQCGLAEDADAGPAPMAPVVGIADEREQQCDDSRCLPHGTCPPAG